MSEQQLKDFAEAAERRVAVPDLADLDEPGTGPAPGADAPVRSARSRSLVAVGGGVVSSVVARRPDRPTR